MTQGDIYPQVDGAVRYTYECPRGTVAIEEAEDGTRHVTRCLGSALTRRDIRAAVRLHEELLAEEEA